MSLIMIKMAEAKISQKNDCRSMSINKGNERNVNNKAPMRIIFRGELLSAKYPETINTTMPMVINKDCSHIS